VAECKEKKHLPILVIDSKLMPNIAKHIRAAQAAGQPRVLTYLGAGSPQQTSNRKAACGRFKKTTPNGSCDEYPFASVLEGGSGASIMEVPIGEQRTQGGVNNNFYRDKLKSEAGAKFLVVVK